jgi:DNA replication licensing factor MCM6
VSVLECSSLRSHVLSVPFQCRRRAPAVDIAICPIFLPVLIVKNRNEYYLQTNSSEIVNEQPVNKDENDAMDESVDDDDAAPSARTHQYFPYLEQAGQIARRQLKSASSNLSIAATGYDGGVDEDDDGDDSDLSSFSSTICVNYRHLHSYDADLAEAVEAEYVRFEPHIRRAARKFMMDCHPELDRASAGGVMKDGGVASSYFVAMYNAPIVLPVRALRTGTIGRFAAISGTVTRSSDVRPELLVGSFRCRKCGLLAPDVLQQYHLTRPPLCRNPRCQNRSPGDFHLEISGSGGGGGGGDGDNATGGGSEFVDWQRLRVQENADEIPPGSMPRTIDVVLRNEMVERAKPGDRVVLTGSLVVVPDGSALARAGEAARASSSASGGNLRAGKEAASGGGGGVRGLAALGVRELTYRTCFVACCVLPSDVAERIRRRNEGAALHGGHDGFVNESWLFGMGADAADSPKTAQEVAMEFTENEKEEIRRMKGMSRLYDKVRYCIILWFDS